MITYFRSQKDLAQALIKIIDSYWQLKISEPEFIEYLKQVYKNNRDKIISNNELTAVLKQRLDKKRLILLKQILDLKEV